MHYFERNEISQLRHTLQNPYAFIEQIEGAVLPNAMQTDASAAQIFASRTLLENPYAHLDGNGHFSGTASVKERENGLSTQSRSALITYSRSDIEAKVKSIHEVIWRDRSNLWRNAVPQNPIDMLDPALVLGMLGYDYQLAETLGQYKSGNALIEVAGLIDHASKTVRVSNQFKDNVKLFTGAHEAGHAALHPTAVGLHRDRAIDGGALRRERSEQEADLFATFFLMPAKLVVAHFEDLFLCRVFMLDEETAFALSGSCYSELQKKCRTTRDLSRLLVRAESYDGKYFVSLANKFRVSNETMAIRIEELGLVSF